MDLELSTIQEDLEVGETLTCEFKSDYRGKLELSKIVETVVGMANTQGGVLYIGIEDNGVVTGIKHLKKYLVNTTILMADIQKNTMPPVFTTVSVYESPDYDVLCVSVKKGIDICSTTQGKVLKRIISTDGKPATVPMYPYEQQSRRVDLGLLDYSAQRVEGTSFDDLNPLEFERLRQTIKRRNGDQSLLELSDEEFCKALNLVETVGNDLVPTVAGLLLLGRDEVIRRHFPTNMVNFQVLDRKADVRVNEGLTGPLVRILEKAESFIVPRIEESEAIIGIFRYPIPNYDRTGLREAVNNAVLHRDYISVGQVYIQWYPDHILITNPGGFPEGITKDNILVHEPHPRNVRLAEAFLRIGIIEKTGRGVDKIYLGQVMYGRAPPDFSRSDATGVRVIIPGGGASHAFARFVFEEDKKGEAFNLDQLLVMATLYHDREMTSQAAGVLIQKGPDEGRRVLENLHDRGLVEGKGRGRGRVYMLSHGLYKRLNMETEYERRRGIDPVRHEQMILQYIEDNGSITRRVAADLCQIEPYAAGYVLKRMVEKNPDLRLEGTRRWARYVLSDDDSEPESSDS